MEEDKWGASHLLTSSVALVTTGPGCLAPEEQEVTAAPPSGTNLQRGNKVARKGNCMFVHMVSTQAPVWLKLIKSNTKWRKTCFDAKQLVFTNVFTSVIPFSVLAGCAAEVQAVFWPPKTLLAQLSLVIMGLHALHEAHLRGFLGQGTRKYLVWLYIPGRVGVPNFLCAKWKNRADLQGK